MRVLYNERGVKGRDRSDIQGEEMEDGEPMSIVYEQAGRTHQKKRTRDALVAAARELVAQGEMPTVESVAAAASISRTTAGVEPALPTITTGSRWCASARLSLRSAELS